MHIVEKIPLIFFRFTFDAFAIFSTHLARVLDQVVSRAIEQALFVRKGFRVVDMRPRYYYYVGRSEDDCVPQKPISTCPLVDLP